jgi:ectoine hydroxylase-related dioxygenase (phytanoyl-CoA dioxygenase family)
MRRCATFRGVSDDAAIRRHLDRIEDEGYTILEDVLDSELADALLADLDRIVEERGVVPAENLFEGHRTLRVYNLLALGRIWEQIPVHPATLPIAEGVLDRGLLISSLSSIDIGAGEQAQPIHADDQLIPLDKPHRPIVCNTMWALTDFTEENGATRLVPGSHRSDHDPEYGEEYDSIAAEMPKGSVLIWNGSLWHGGGANRTGERRVGIAMNYCAGFIRQQENQQLGIPVEIARHFDERLKRLVGYGIYRGLIGHIDKNDPIEKLGDSADLRVVWDRV